MLIANKATDQVADKNTESYSQTSCLPDIKTEHSQFKSFFTYNFQITCLNRWFFQSDKEKGIKRPASWLNSMRYSFLPDIDTACTDAEKLVY